MRVGSNPAKTDNSLVSPYGQHRVIVPVYIPHHEDYFKHALDITLICLESLHLTAGEHVSVTVVSNGCSDTVNKELTNLYERGWINQLIFDHQNRGKVNACLALARGAYEPLITITDADILFLHGWLDSLYHLFQSFPECGFASPLGLPSPPNCRHFSATLIGAWLKHELKFKSIFPMNDIIRHAEGMGKSMKLVEANRLGHLIVERGESIACIGASHAVFTLRKEVVRHLPINPNVKFSEAMDTCIDTPVDKAGFWRLCPDKATAWHMGNVLNEEILDKMEQVRSQAAIHGQQSEDLTDVPVFANDRSSGHWSSAIPWQIRRRLASVIRSKYIPQEIHPYF